MSYVFERSLLQAISDWQRGGDARQNRKRGIALKDACASLPRKYRSSALCCFRQIALPKGGVWDLIGEDRLSEKISSWTTSIEVAKRIKGGVPPQHQGYQGVIFCLRPKCEDVIINLAELYRAPSFKAALEHNKASITGCHEGAGRYANDQSEVVLEIAAVTQQDIYSMGGYSSPFEQLVDIAADAAYGLHATQEQRDALLLKAEQVRAESGPHWLDPKATQRVLNRLQAPSAQLREIKRQQDSG